MYPFPSTTRINGHPFTKFSFACDKPTIFLAVHFVGKKLIVLHWRFYQICNYIQILIIYKQIVELTETYSPAEVLFAHN